MRLALVAILALVSCAKPNPSVIYGTWQSNESLTLEQVASADLSAKQREFIEQPGFFGNLRVTYEEGRVLTEFQGSRAYSPYRAVHSTEDSVAIEHMDPLTGDIVVQTVVVRGDQLWMPVRNLGFYEVFTKVECTE
jgi:hypothetical protein